MADWIVDGDPGLDLWHMDLRRFGPQYRSRRLVTERAREIYGTYYDIRYPHQERETGRGLRLSPVHPRLRELGAVFGEKAGWERANWFEPNAAAGSEARRPRGFAGRVWSPAIEAEHRATRERVALFDETSFAKLEVLGPGALALLQRLTANDVDRPVGSVTYTAMLNSRGGIECDFTVTRLGGRPLPDRHRLGLRHPRPRLDRRPPPARRVGVPRGRDRRLTRVSACSGRAPGTCSPRRRTPTCRTRASRT